MEFKERKRTGDCFCSGQNRARSMEFPLYKIFADPFTPSALLLTRRYEGFCLKSMIYGAKRLFSLPEELYDLLVTLEHGQVCSQVCI